GTKGALDGQPVEILRSCPALRRAQYDGRPPGASIDTVSAGTFLDGANLRIAGVQRGCEMLVHPNRLAALDEVRVIAACFQKGADIVIGGAAKNCGAGDLVAI